MSIQILGPALFVISGSMFSGKSEELIRRLRILQHSDIRVLVVKPFIDKRRDDSTIYSRNGIALPAITVHASKDILDFAAEYDVIGIDEGQFFDMLIPKELMRVVKILLSMGKHVIVAGLDNDFEGEPFENIAFLLGHSEDSVKLHTICMRCKQRPASRSHRKTAGTSRVELGDKNNYEALCLRCFALAKHGVAHSYSSSSKDLLSS